MNEWEPTIAPEVPFRQGDAIAWGNWRQRDGWDRFGVILTADCDIAQGRVSQFLTYLPIIDAGVYLNEVWAKNRLSRMRDGEIVNIGGQLHKYHRRFNPDARYLPDSEVEAWILADSVENILEALQIDQPKEKAALSAGLQKVKQIVQWARDNDAANTLSRYAKALAVRGGQAAVQTREKILRDAKSDLVKNLPTDSYFLTSLPQVDVSGCVCMLRYIRPIDMSSLATSYVEAREKNDMAFRLGRLSPTVKYALTQKFAALFTRIGLPQDFEEWQQLVAEDSCDSVLKIAIGE
jgi:hypothetical protein